MMSDPTLVGVTLGLFLTLLIMLVLLGRALVSVPPGRIGLVDPYGPAPRLLGQGLNFVRPFQRYVILDPARPSVPPHGSRGRVVFEFPDGPGYVVVAVGSNLVVGYVGRTGALGTDLRATGRVTTLEALTVLLDPGPGGPTDRSPLLAGP